MSNVKKNSSGLILYDLFNNIDNWEAIPSASLFSISDSLIIQHNPEPTYLLLSNLPKEFIMEVSNVYNPTNTGSEGGIIIKQDDNNKLEFLEYYDGSTNSYPYMKVKRFYNVYSFYTSQDNINWDFEGVYEGDFEAPKIGLCLYDNVFDYKVDYVKIYKNNKIVINNVPPEAIVQLKDSSGNVLLTQTCPSDGNSVEFMHDNYPLFGHFTFIVDGQTIDVDNNMIIWGGDEYQFEIGLDVLYNGVIVPPDEITFLGQLQVNEDGERLLSTSFVLHNPFSDYVFNNVNVNVLQYDHDNYYNFVDISLDNVSFTKNLIISSVNTDVTIYVKATRDSNSPVSQANFYIRVFFEV